MTNNETIQDPVTDELLSWIESAARRLCTSAGGLTDQQARTIVMPSGWSIAGLIGHVHDSTWFWLHHVAAGHPVDFDDKDWDNDPAMPFSELLDSVSRDTAKGCAEVRALPSTVEPGWWPDGAWGGYRLNTVRGVLIHLLNDNAAHTGQLDIVREQLDGGVWDYAVHGIRLPGKAG